MSYEKDNVIIFPVIKKKPPNENSEAQKKAIADEITLDLIDDVSLDIIKNLLQDIQYNGIEVTSSEFNKDIGLLIEATKAILSRHYQQSHFLHKLSEEIFDTHDDGGVYLNSNNVHFNFRKETLKSVDN